MDRVANDPNSRLQVRGVDIATYDCNQSQAQWIATLVARLGRGRVRLLVDRHILSDSGRGNTRKALAALASAVGGDNLRIVNTHAKTAVLHGPGLVIASSENLTGAPRCAWFSAFCDPDLADAFERFVSLTFADLPAYPAAASASAGGAVLRAAAGKVALPMAAIPAPAAAAPSSAATSKGLVNGAPAAAVPASGAPVLVQKNGVKPAAAGGEHGTAARLLACVERLSSAAAISSGDIKNLAAARGELMRQRANLGGVEPAAIRELVERLDRTLPGRGPSRRALRDAVRATAAALRGEPVSDSGRGPVAALLDGATVPTLEGRKLAAQAATAELDRRRATGELVPRAEVIAGWEFEHVRLRQGLEALPERMRLELQHLGAPATVAANWAETAIHDCLKSLAEEPPGLPPDQFGGI